MTSLDFFRIFALNVKLMKLFVMKKWSLSNDQKFF
jgi:hypothetical protein